MFWLTYVQKLFKALNENVSPNEIAGGVVLGSIIGLIPKTNLLALFIWILILLLQVNIAMATFAIVVFAIVGHITDPLFEKLGYLVLTGIPGLEGFWTWLYNLPIVPFTSFNNTLVMGNLIAGILLAPFVFLGMRRFVVAYRTRYREKIMKWKIVQVITASKLWDLYMRWVNR
jgi:uncharacterized protein (TIGR03546 family)